MYVLEIGQCASITAHTMCEKETILRLGRKDGVDKSCLGRPENCVLVCMQCTVCVNIQT